MRLLSSARLLSTTMAALDRSHQHVTNHRRFLRMAVATPTAVPTPALPKLTAQTHVVWFRNDLRVDDNYALSAAAREAQQSGGAVLPVFVLDPEQFGQTPWGAEKTGARRAKFLIESIADLRQNLRNLGSDLLVAVGSPDAVLGSLQPASVHTCQQVTSEELRQDKNVKRALRQNTRIAQGEVPPLVHTHWDNSLYHVDDLPLGAEPAAMPLTFTPWRNKVEKKSTPRAPLDPPAPGSLPLPADTRLTDALNYLPTLPDLGLSAGEGASATDMPAHDPRGVMEFTGGETAAMARIQGWMFDRDCLKDYFQTRNGMLGADYSSKLAPWLAHGCISPRRIYAMCKQYERERVENKSTYWLVFELVWRDFFKYMAFKVGDKLFGLHGVVPRQNAQWRDPLRDGEAGEDFARWKAGQTGFPLVDANMRELASTGFMSNRGRQNVASFLVLDLGIDWRAGADYFESQLIDYDCASNWGNWVAAAGLTGGRVNRFNIGKQTRDYDPQGHYLRHWIPELGEVPSGQIPEPWKMSKADQDQYQVLIGSDYPRPLKRQYTGGEGGGGGGQKRSGGGDGGRHDMRHKYAKNRKGGGGSGGGGDYKQVRREKNRQRSRVQSGFADGGY